MTRRVERYGAFEVCKGATGWVVIEYEQNVVTGQDRPGGIHRGTFPDRARARHHARFKRDLAAGKFDHVGRPTGDPS